MADFQNYNIPQNNSDKFTSEQERQIRELIAASLANWTGVTRFRTIESVVTIITDFTDSQHNHTNTAGGGQLTDAALSSVVTVPKGGTGVNTLTGIAKGNGAGIFTAIVPLAGTKTYWVSDTSGGAVNRKLTFTDGILTAEN